MTKDQIFKKEYSFELLRIAVEDLESCQALYETKKGRTENVCFLAQQVVEKVLKAALCFLEKPVPFTHNLDFLLERLPQDKIPPHSDNLSVLTEYGTIRRYEEGIIKITSEDLAATIKAAKEVLDWGKSLILQ